MLRNINSKKVMWTCTELTLCHCGIIVAAIAFLVLCTKQNWKIVLSFVACILFFFCIFASNEEKTRGTEHYAPACLSEKAQAALVSQYGDGTDVKSLNLTKYEKIGICLSLSLCFSIMAFIVMYEDKEEITEDMKKIALKLLSLFLVLLMYFASLYWGLKLTLWPYIKNSEKRKTKEIACC